jgi:bifunctional ADP-heptose synthase (sugar kinase/adenylyltransferase)
MDAVMVFDEDTPVRLMRKLASILMLTAVPGY